MTEADAVEMLHQISTFYLVGSVIATSLVQVIPPPTEIGWKPYVVLYNTILRFSVAKRPNAPGEVKEPRNESKSG